LHCSAVDATAEQIADLTKSTYLLVVLRSRVRIRNLLLYNSRSF